MRDKEAIEAERKNLARTLEKQGKAVDHFTELEKQLETQKVIVLILVHRNPIYEISFLDYP
jgi:E3 ubiquitin-protein ligase BRE1